MIVKQEILKQKMFFLSFLPAHSLAQSGPAIKATDSSKSWEMKKTALFYYSVITTCGYSLTLE